LVRPSPRKQGHRLHDDAVKVARAVVIASKARPHQPHRQRVAGGDRHPRRVIPDQAAQAFADLGGRMAVVGQHQNAARVLALHADQVGNPMHQHPCLA
jgi:hypothetical protein